MGGSRWNRCSTEVKRIRMEVKSLSERKWKIIQLERLLESMIGIEEYELCIQLRDMIKRLKETK
jgi:protein-arginine kinase activator protein McsA